jgi:lysophospholipase-3
MKFSIFLTLLTTVAAGQDIFGRTFYPVIIIPGLEGSRLEARRSLPNANCSIANNGSTLLWLDPVKILSSLDCFLDTFMLHYDRETHSTHNTEGVEVSVPFFGETKGVETLNDLAVLPELIEAQPLVTFFVAAGRYNRGVNIRGAPYDFRKGENELQDYFDQLKDLIEDTFNQQNMRVVIVSHSMGGLHALYFLHRQSQEWKNQYIHRFITMSAPFGGSMDSVSAYLTGIDSLGVIPFFSKEGILNTITSLPSVAALLPNKFGWSPDQPLVEGSHVENITLANLERLFDLLDLPDVKAMYNDTKNLIDLQHPGVNITCVFSLGLFTKETAHYDDEADFPSHPRWKFGDGDHTVGAKSLQTCLKWSTNPEFAFSSKVFEGIQHQDMIKDLRVASYLYDSIVRDKF